MQTFSLSLWGAFVVVIVVTAITIAGLTVGSEILLLLAVAVEASCCEDDSPTFAFSECKLWVLSPLLVLAKLALLVFFSSLFFGRFGEGSNGPPCLTAYSISTILRNATKN